MTNNLIYALIRTKASGVIVLYSEFVDSLTPGRVEVISKHETWEAAQAARARLPKGAK